MYGGTAEQVRLLLQAPGLVDSSLTMIEEALAGVGEGRDRLLRAIAYPEAGGRVLDSQRLLQELWRADGGLGPYPLLDLLADFETEHAYYPAYRDHLVHQVRVWLLGLYLLRRLPRLLAAVTREVADDETVDLSPDEVMAEALRRWKVTALWHDLGYVFEVQSAKAPQELIKRTFNGLNATFATPLAALGIANDEEEGLWQQEAAYEQPLPPWPRLKSFDTLVAGRAAELWKVLAPAGWSTGLAGPGEESGGLRPYFEICRSGDLTPADRSGFTDHGIAGALLLLRLHRFMVYYAVRVEEYLEQAPDQVPEDQRQAISQLADRTAASLLTITAAVQAIALHNIVPGLPLKATAVARGLTPDRFRIALDGDTARPLAYLLALADGLQGWDRPRFTAPRAPDDIGLIDQHVELVADETRIYLRYRLDEPMAGNQLRQLRQELGERLDGIGDLLVSDEMTCSTPLLPFETATEVQAEPGEWDLGPYLDAIIHECGTVELKGIVPSGRARGALEVPIQEIYAPLRVEGGDDDLWRLLVDPSRRYERLTGEVDAVEEEHGSHRVLLLVGEPGSGKSTFLRMTAAVLAYALGGEPWAREHAAAQAFLEAGDELPVPVMIRLSELTAFAQADAHQADMAVEAPTLVREYLAHWAETRSTGIPATVVETWLRQGKAVLLLDGLDEIPSRQLRERIGRIIGNAIAEGVYGACHFCLTSRPLRDEGYQAGLAPRTIEGLGDEAIRSFLERWASFVGRGSQDPAAYAADLIGQTRQASPAIRAMLRNPLMLTCLAVIHWNEHRLPEQRAELLEAIVSWLLRARHIHDRTLPELGEHQRRRIFQALATYMHCRDGGRVRELALPEAAQAVSEYFEGDSELAATRFLEAETVVSGLVTPRGQDHLQFWHLSLQELLVADLIAASTEDRWPNTLTEERRYHPEWREVLLLLAGRLGNSERAQALLRLILAPANRKDSSLTVKARAYGLAMAAVRDLGPYQLVPAPDLGLDALGQEVMRIFEPEGAEVPLKVRVEAAEALGQAGDPRPLGDSWVETEPGLWFAGYPVTVQEYARFVDDGGYDPEGFGKSWIDEWQAGVEEMLKVKPYKDIAHLKDDRSRRAPSRWEEQLTAPTRPVVGVSWFDASAYCRWLTGSQPGEWSYQLPTEQGWKRAARGAGGSGRYPWGDADPGEGDNARANYDKAGINAPTPVGLFPAGAAAWGETGDLQDMAGNVWEWCADELSEDAQPEDGGLFRPLRGGSYWFVAVSLEVSYRYCFHAALWFDFYGFRVVRRLSRRRPP
jgi:formylglycine-generating enzyme required for sulfatase activity/energy-coupling factor transporter ATP-binding protein EcfA2